MREPVIHRSERYLVRTPASITENLMYLVCSNTNIILLSLQPKCIEFISVRQFRIRGYARRCSRHLGFKLIFKHGVGNSFGVAGVFNAIFVGDEGCMMVIGNPV